MRVLVAYGSERGSTAEIAGALGDELTRAGLPADVRPAEAVLDVRPYGAVILGGALYMGRWHPAARRFARKYHGALRGMPVWLFSSGPLDGTADEREIPPVRFVAGLAADIRARGHATFGGRLAPDAKGFMAATMAKKMAGDFRNWDRIREWARRVARELERTTVPHAS
jgi:menaquinone-dependent protoporphyrinogen oxidase